MRELERRCRVLTGAVLALVAFVSTYCLLLLEGQADRPGFLLYPFLLAMLFYLAGDLLALIWLRIIGAQMQRMMHDAAAKQDAAAHLAAVNLPPLEEDVEVIRPRKGEGSG